MCETDVQTNMAIPPKMPARRIRFIVPPECLG
jgi:hypothetical protein